MLLVLVFMDSSHGIDPFSLLVEILISVCMIKVRTLQHTLLLSPARIVHFTLPKIKQVDIWCLHLS